MLLGQHWSLYRSRAARTGRCTCPQILSRHWLQQLCLDVTATPHSFADLPMQVISFLSTRILLPWVQRLHIQGFVGLAMAPSADPVHGALTRQHLASCAGSLMGGPCKPRGLFSIPGSTCPGEPLAQDAQGGRGPGPFPAEPAPREQEPAQAVLWL